MNKVGAFLILIFGLGFWIWTQTNEIPDDSSTEQTSKEKEEVSNQINTDSEVKEKNPIESIEETSESSPNTVVEKVEVSKETTDESKIITIGKKDDGTPEVVTQKELEKHIAKVFSNTYENELKKEEIKRSEKSSQKNGTKIKTFDNKYQKFDRNVDILWVIDDSGSMKEHLEKVSKKISIFIEEFLKKNVSFKMGVVSTSLELLHEGSVLNSDVYKKNEPEFVSKFKDIFNLRTIGSGDEKGLGAVTHFLDANGERFLRPKSKLVVIVISDEDDHSNSPANYDKMMSTKEFTDHVSKFRTGGDFELYSIISFPPKVPGLAGVRYADVSYVTKGLVADIQGDFHQMLLNIGGRIVKSIEKKTD
ncbi:MAG: VWA domain-containing protein [Deltaproteobacteria bacterium]|nr:MAG: VWA domain-containing protein [Deltaproteobacteria bacterium]